MPSSTFFSVKNFTPVPDSLVTAYGLMTAAVYGRVYRYCRMRTNTCYASMQTLADGLHIDRRTIMRHLAVLVEDGYLEDKTPDVRNRPHVYKITDKLTWTVELGVAESHTTPVNGVTKSHSGVTESHLKKEVRNNKKQKLGKGDNAIALSRAPKPGAETSP